jgi:hypothetical protein
MVFSVPALFATYQFFKGVANDCDHTTGLNYISPEVERRHWSDTIDRRSQKDFVSIS